MLRLLPRSTSRFSPGSLLTRSLSSSSSAPGVPPPFAVEQWSGWESGLHVLSNSDCAPLKQSTLLAMATPEQKEAWDNLELGYGEQRGATFLREAICKTYETTDPATGEELPAITPEHVNVVVPAEGIFLAATALLSPGDEVVCAMPCYQSLHQLAETRGCSVTPWMPTVASRPGQSSFMFGPDETLYHNFDVAELERLVTPDTKMVVLNFPHNPTGAMLTSAELRKVVEICAKADALVQRCEGQARATLRQGARRRGSRPSPVHVDDAARAHCTCSPCSPCHDGRSLSLPPLPSCCCPPRAPADPPSSQLLVRRRDVQVARAQGPGDPPVCVRDVPEGHLPRRRVQEPRPARDSHRMGDDEG